jgi:hypothetical protein
MKTISPCCKAPFSLFVSLNKKKCSECGKWYEWKLGEKQKPIFDGKHE